MTLATPEAARGKSQQYVAFVGVPGETIELNAETDNKYTYGGTKFYKEFAEMKNALENTYGILVYQEQFMQISKEVCGFTGGQADTLRKAVGKKKIDLMKKMKGEFIEGE